MKPLQSNDEQLEYSKSVTASASSLEEIPSAAPSLVATLTVPTPSNMGDRPATPSSQKEQNGGLPENAAEPIADLFGNPRFSFGSECRFTFFCN